MRAALAEVAMPTSASPILFKITPPFQLLLSKECRPEEILLCVWCVCLRVCLSACVCSCSLVTTMTHASHWTLENPEKQWLTPSIMAPVLLINGELMQVKQYRKYFVIMSDDRLKRGQFIDSVSNDGHTKTAFALETRAWQFRRHILRWFCSGDFCSVQFITVWFMYWTFYSRGGGQGGGWMNQRLGFILCFKLEGQWLCFPDYIPPTIFPEP